MTDAKPAMDALAAFEAELRSGAIATFVLERRAGGPIRAEAVGASAGPIAPDIRAALACAANDAVTHRHTQLMRGDVLLSVADLWYLPARLTAAMNHALAVGDLPFGAIIAPLDPYRRTLSIDRLAGPEAVLRVRAVVLTAEGRPLAVAHETYRRAALG